MLIPDPPAIEGIPPPNLHQTNDTEPNTTSKVITLEGITGIIPPNHIRKKNGKTIPSKIVRAIFPNVAELAFWGGLDTATASISSAGC